MHASAGAARRRGGALPTRAKLLYAAAALAAVDAFVNYEPAKVEDG